MSDAARDANKRIAAKARRLHFTARVPFVCECGDPRCREFVLLHVDDYERALAVGAGYVTVPGHGAAPLSAR